MSDTTFDHPPAGTTSTGRRRHIGIDVGRAVALIGVVVMNYHGMMNYRGQIWQPSGLFERTFDISTGIFTTRFAATFVVIAGIAASFLTRPTPASQPQHSVSSSRMRMLRRSLVLLASGYVLNKAWPGTIIFFYGAYFICAAFVFHLGTRLLSAITVLIAGGGVGIAVWRRMRFQDGDATNWMDPANLDSVGDFLLRVFIGYTHPVLPWMAFFTLGILLGRVWNVVITHPRGLIAICSLTVVMSYVAATGAQIFQWRDNAVIYALTSMQPSERGLLYFMSTAGIAVLAVLGINWIATRYQSVSIIRHLQRAGQMTLTLYLLHVLFYYVVVDWSGLVTSDGLITALLVAGLYWLGAITVASWWHHRLGQGPAERIYRLLGG